jgi:hypothetical protein
MDLRDLYLAAKFLIDAHGHDARTLAVHHLFAMRMLEDEAGARVWRRVRDAIDELLATRPAEGERVH